MTLEAILISLGQALLLLVIGAVLKSWFDKIAVERGWAREDRKAQDGKIERVDHHARAELTRIERELGGRVSTVEGQLGVLNQRIDALPTADDIAALDRRVADMGAELGRGLSGVTSTVQGMSTTVKTILDHILEGERRK